MLAELVTKARQMQVETGNHIDWCINKVAHALSDRELMTLAEETGDKRFIRKATRLVNHDDDYSNPDETYRNRKSHHADVAITADSFIRAANREQK